MSRLVRFSTLLATGMLLASGMFAQSAGSMDTDSPARQRPLRERASSSSVSSALAASMPRYNPPPKPKPEDENVDLREVDKPRNGIIRLPKYTVQQRRPPVFRERDVYTSGGLADLARRRYLTPTYRLLNSVYIPFFTASPEEHALAMYAEDERLGNMSDLKSTARDVGVADPAEGAYIKRVTNETYMRRSDFGYSTPEAGRRP
jgi:hypothetical protein